MQQLIFTNSRGQSIELKNTCPFLLQKFDPGTPKTTLIATKAPGQDGKSYHGTLLEPTELQIEGSIIANSIQDMYAKRRLLNSVFNPKITGTITYLNDAGTYTIDCVVQDSPTLKDKNGCVQQFLIQLCCPDPYWKEIQEAKKEIALWLGYFKFPLEIPADTGIEMGHRVSNLIVNANNPGDVECSMRIEFTALASVVNPSLFNVYTQEYIRVNRTLVAGDKLIINTTFGNKTVQMIHNGVTSNVFYYIDLNSTFLQLAVGDNLLRYNAEQGIDNLECAIYYTPKYVGV